MRMNSSFDLGNNTKSDNMAFEKTDPTMLMYKRCSKHEKWKNFQTKRYVNIKHQKKNPMSTLPILKFHKDKIYKSRGSK